MTKLIPTQPEIYTREEFEQRQQMKHAPSAKRIFEPPLPPGFFDNIRESNKRCRRKYLIEDISMFLLIAFSILFLVYCSK